jgi:23S rRNA-/tRNA-specific pseudouridylate synthase
VAGSAPRHLLHALAATFVHPATGKETTIRVPRPDWAR